MKLSSRHCGVCKYLKVISHDPHQSPGILTTPWGDSAPRRGCQLGKGRGGKAPSQGIHAQPTSLGWASLKDRAVFQSSFSMHEHFALTYSNQGGQESQGTNYNQNKSSLFSLQCQETGMNSMIYRQQKKYHQRTSKLKSKKALNSDSWAVFLCQSYFGVCRVQGGRQPGGCSPFDD